jgi:hypothetical protein
VRHVRTILTTAAVLALALGSTATLRAQTPGDKERKELAIALGGAKVSLAQGLAAAAKIGKPISAKFEVEDGKLQLSVYTMKGESFSEVVVDHATGKVVKTEAITSGEDLTAAKAQSAAMAAAKGTLHAAVEKALKANPGYLAVSVFPTLKDGHASADVMVVKLESWKTIAESLE